MSEFNDFMVVAGMFLDHLEGIHQNGVNIPARFVMKRIQHLLAVCLQEPSLRAEASGHHQAEPSPAVRGDQDEESWDAAGGDQDEESWDAAGTTSDEAAAGTASTSRGPGIDSSNLAKLYADPLDAGDELVDLAERASSRCIADKFRKDINAIVRARSPVFVDVQYMMSDQGPVIKEFAATCEDGPMAWILVLPPPGAVQAPNINKFVQYTYNELSWSEGSIEVAEFKKITKIFFRVCHVQVKGLPKIDVLVKALGVSRKRLTTLDHYPRLDELRRRHLHSAPKCPSHDYNDQGFLACSLLHAHVLLQETLLNGWRFS